MLSDNHRQTTKSQNNLMEVRRFDKKNHRKLYKILEDDPNLHFTHHQQQYSSSKCQTGKDADGGGSKCSQETLLEFVKGLDADRLPLIANEVAVQLLKIQSKYLDDHPYLCTSRFRHTLHLLPPANHELLEKLCFQLHDFLAKSSCNDLCTSEKKRKFYSQFLDAVFDSGELRQKEHLFSCCRKHGDAHHQKPGGGGGDEAVVFCSIASSSLESKLQAVLARLVSDYRAIFAIEGEFVVQSSSSSSSRAAEDEQHEHRKHRREEGEKDECPEEIKFMKVACEELSLECSASSSPVATTPSSKSDQHEKNSRHAEKDNIIHRYYSSMLRGLVKKGIHHGHHSTEDPNKHHHLKFHHHHSHHHHHHHHSHGHHHHHHHRHGQSTSPVSPGSNTKAFNFGSLAAKSQESSGAAEKWTPATTSAEKIHCEESSSSFDNVCSSTTKQRKRKERQDSLSSEQQDKKFSRCSGGGGGAVDPEDASKRDDSDCLTSAAADQDNQVSSCSSSSTDSQEIVLQERNLKPNEEADTTSAAGIQCGTRLKAACSRKGRRSDSLKENNGDGENRGGDSKGVSKPIEISTGFDEDDEPNDCSATAISCSPSSCSTSSDEEATAKSFGRLIPNEDDVGAPEGYEEEEGIRSEAVHRFRRLSTSSWGSSSSCDSAEFASPMSYRPVSWVPHVASHLVAPPPRSLDFNDDFGVACGSRQAAGTRHFGLLNSKRHLDPSHMTRADASDADSPKRTRLRRLNRELSGVRKRLDVLEQECEREHGYRLSQAEKSKRKPIRKLMLEETMLKRQIRSCRDSSDFDDVAHLMTAMSETSPLLQPLDASSSSPGSPMSCDSSSSETEEDPKSSCEVAEDLAFLKFLLRPSSSSRRRAISNNNETGNRDLEAMRNCLEDKERWLEAERQAAERPFDPEEMSQEQLIQEKADVHFAIHQLEKAFDGRANTEEQKAVVKSIYDRYRAVKRQMRRSSSQGRSKDPLELVTIPEGTEVPLTLASPQQRINIEITSSASIGSNAAEVITDGIQNSLKSLDMPCFDASLRRIETNLHSMGRHELRRVHRRTREEQKLHKRAVKEKEERLLLETGRKKLPKDQRVDDSNYSMYKLCKSKLRLIEALLSKPRSVRRH